MLEQKVWLTTTAPLYPNIYCFLVGHPGVGKTRTIMAASAFVRELTDFHIAPTSMTMASMVDCLLEAKRTIIRMPEGPLEYNSMYILADELTAFMHKFEEEIIGGLTTFYDVNIPYGQHRRGKEIKIKIKKPQLSILSGTTPSNLLKFLPEFAWDQGFTSRVMMVFSDERPMKEDIFEIEERGLPADMVHDMRVIAATTGEFNVSDTYKSAISNWRKLSYTPLPRHPRLTHYCTRRLAHLLKLSMVACVDRGQDLRIDTPDFNRAMGWLLEAEQNMSDIFKAGSTGSDGKAMDEIWHYMVLADKGTGVPERVIVNFARERVPAHSVMRVVEVMERSGMIHATHLDPKTGTRIFKPTPKNAL